LNTFVNPRIGPLPYEINRLAATGSARDSASRLLVLG
jgi:hypothetical protein